MPILSDSKVRERISGSKEGLAVNLLVEAGAGTGKTRHLTQRVSRLLEMVSHEELSSIVAITFTEKAAGEMIDRLRHNLEIKAHMGDIVKILPILQRYPDQNLLHFVYHILCLFFHPGQRGSIHILRSPRSILNLPF
ncbi:MAG: UvrD-helicase domain-containing protein, partial [bacterium]